MSKYHIVALSGGLDSSLIATQLVSDSSVKVREKIRFVYFNYLGNKDKNEKELQAIEYLKKILTISDDRIYRITISEFLPIDSGKEHVSIQSCMWSSWIAGILPFNCNVYFGYIKGDDEPGADADYFAKAIKYAHYGKFNRKTKIKIKYPLKNYNKSAVIEELRERNIDISKLWWCEDYVNTRAKGWNQVCGECNPCRRYMATLRYMEEPRPLRGVAKPVETESVVEKDFIIQLQGD